MELGNRPGVVIFSRSGHDDYRWLLNILRVDLQVSTFFISNNNHFQFREEVQKCRFGILYHTKNRGRVNITDVTDSLYDKEISFLSSVLGKNYVIVVVDDLDDSSINTKNRILENQPSLRTQTRDIFLFTIEEKANHETLRHKVQIIMDLIPIDLDSAPIYVPGRDGDSGRGRDEGIIMPLMMVCLPSMLVWWNTYLSPVPGRVDYILSGLWILMCGRILRWKPSTPLLPFRYQGRSALACTVAFLSAYNANYKSSISNITLCVLWITACSRHLFPGYYRKQTRLNGTVMKIMTYGLALFTFWKGWQSPNTSEVQQIYRAILLSPVILASE